MTLKVEPGLAGRFPGLQARVLRVIGVTVGRSDPLLEAFKAEVAGRATQRWSLDDLREAPMFRTYRDFFWRVGVDPTKTRPAAEALIRRILRGAPFPTVNTLVDAYNLASVDSAIPFGAFDLDLLSGGLRMRAADPGEVFLGIGMEDPIRLGGGEPVVEDGEKLIAVYPYRDADSSRVTESTGRVLLLTCGVPGVSLGQLEEAEALCAGYIARFNGGAAEG